MVGRTQDRSARALDSPAAGPPQPLVSLARFMLFEVGASRLGVGRPPTLASDGTPFHENAQRPPVVVIDGHTTILAHKVAQQVLLRTADPAGAVLLATGSCAG